MTEGGSKPQGAARRETPTTVRCRLLARSPPLVAFLPGTRWSPSCPVSTPGPPPPPIQQATMARASWERQLEAYTKAASGSTPPPQRAARTRMVDAVRAAPESPEAWAALLAAEEAALGASTGTLTGERGAGARGGVTLFDLYAAATKAVPRANNYTNDAYVRIWLGFARHQRCVALAGGPVGCGRVCIHACSRHAVLCCPYRRPEASVPLLPAGCAMRTMHATCSRCCAPRPSARPRRCSTMVRMQGVAAGLGWAPGWVFAASLNGPCSHHSSQLV